MTRLLIFYFKGKSKNFLNFVSISVAKLKSVFCWGTEQVIHQGQILSSTGKKAGSACPVLLSWEEQFLSEPRPRLARLLSQLAHSWATALPSGQRFRSGGCSQGARSKDTRNTFLMVLGRYLENRLL